MDNSLTLTDQQLNELRNQIDEHKKRQEYERLKQDLFNITYQANHTLTEFDGGMKQVDTEKVLSTNNTKKSLSEIFIARLIKMCAVRPIIGNLIAVTLAIVSIFSLHGFLHNPDLGSLKIWLSYFIELAAGVQILKSASRSLVLPITATLVGAIVANQLTGHQLFLQHPVEFYQIVLITGLIGIAISVFSID
jgi:hypothetical protein